MTLPKEEDTTPEPETTSHSVFNNLTLQFPKPMRRMSAMIMDKVTPLGSRRNSSNEGERAQKSPLDERAVDAERENHLSPENNKRRNVNIVSEEHNYKQYVHNIAECSVNSPTSGCSTCIDGTM